MAKNKYRKTKDNGNYSNLIGIKRGLIVKGGEEEKKVINEIAKFFAITFSKEGRFKQTKYIYNFLQPGESFREHYNLYNEVLLLFSEYREFDSRTLDLVDKILEEFENRLDKVCVFLVSNDSKIESKIKNITSSNKDSKIIVPFTYFEILKQGLTKEYVNDKMRRYFYNRDLFALESPLKTDTYFYGRSKLIQELYDKYLLGEQSGLFGLRKTGKTSVLYALERQMMLRKGSSLYIDCQNPSVYLCNWNDLLSMIINEIANKFSLGYPTEGDGEAYIPRNASTSFEKDLIWQSSKLSGRILIMFDEIEHISFQTGSADHWKSGIAYCMFWQTLRSVFQKHPECFTFLIAGVNPLCIEASSVGEAENPIFDMISIKYLNLFSIENVSAMTQEIGKYMGLTFDKEIFTRLTENYGGHPFLIRHVCSLINKENSDSRPCEISKYEYDDNKKQYDKQIVHYVEMVLSVLERWYPSEYDLLEILVVDGSESFKEKIVYKEREINHLIGYGIIKEIKGRYYVTIEAVSRYITNVHKLEKKPTNKEEIWKEICIRRNGLEEKLRKLMVVQVTSQYGKKQVKTKLLEVIETNHRSMMQDKEVTYLVENQFYLLDVKKVIIKHWALFEKIFIDKVKFESFIEMINKYRVDAHAKTIKESDLGVLLIAFNWFDECLEGVLI